MSIDLLYIFYMGESKKRSKKVKQTEMVLTLPINFDDINKKTEKKVSDERSEKNIFTLGTNSSSEDEFSGTDTNTRELLVKLEEKENAIKLLKEELKMYKMSNKISYHGNKKVVSIDFNIKRVDNEIKYEDNSTCCWWCHHPIPENPVFLPERYNGNTYFVTGIFCTFPCAAKYNADTIDDYKTSERYSFLKQMYNEMYKNNDDIKLAEDWRFTKKHGGYMTIEEFRAKSEKDVSDCRIVYPPMYFSNPTLIEISRSGISAPVEDKLVLKRSKPLPRNKHTLMDSMGLILEKKN